MTLERELQTYAERLPKLLADEGRYVLIHGGEVVGIFTAYEDALAAGYERCGLTPFLVKRISAVEPVHRFTRPLGLCPT
jgi:hypothetical protein